MRKEVWDIHHQIRSRMITTYWVIVEGQSLMSELESGLKWSGDQDLSRVSQMGIKIDIWTDEYNLNYLFKYSKSMAKPGSIITMVPT